MRKSSGIECGSGLCRSEMSSGSLLRSFFRNIFWSSLSCINVDNGLCKHSGGFCTDMLLSRFPLRRNNCSIGLSMCVGFIWQMKHQLSGSSFRTPASGSMTPKWAAFRQYHVRPSSKLRVERCPSCAPGYHTRTDMMATETCTP